MSQESGGAEPPPDPDEQGLAGVATGTAQWVTRRTAGEPVPGSRGNGPPGPLTGRSTSRTGRGNGGGRTASVRAAADPHPPEAVTRPEAAAPPEEQEDWDMVGAADVNSDVEAPQANEDHEYEPEWQSEEDTTEIRRAEEAFRRLEDERLDAQDRLQAARMHAGGRMRPRHRPVNRCETHINRGSSTKH
jgi:hypothetical protein